MRSELEILDTLGVDSSALEPAPGGPLRFAGGIARVDPRSSDRRPCSSCGDPAYATQRIDVPGHGLRWLDKCRGHLLRAARAQWS